MSALPTPPSSTDTSPKVGRYESHTVQIPIESYSLNSPDSDSDSDSEPELDCDSLFTGPSFTLSHTYSHPEIPRFPRTYYHSRSTSVTSSSCAPTPLDDRPQTPPSPRATAFLATPSPLCLGPSICHIGTVENDFGGGTVYLDKRCDDRNITEHDELHELVTPASFPVDDPTTQDRFHLHPLLLPTRISSPPSHSTSQLYNIDNTVEDPGITRPRAMTLPTDSVVPQPDSHDDHTNDSVIISRVVSSKVHHTLHRKKSIFNLRDEFRKRSSTC